MKFSLSVVASAAAAFTVGASNVPSLTPDNYETATDGKTVFIKFFAPWCGHCKSMVPAWEKLANEWEGHDTGFIAEVDCTSEGKPLCDANGVRGFPTLKYGDPAALDDYSGGRDYDSLSAFAKKNLKPVCSPSNIDLCDDDKKAEIEKFMNMSDKELADAISKEEKKLEDAEANFKAEVQKLQDAYQKLTSNKEEKIAAVKSSGLGLMKSVKAAKAKDKKDEL